MTDLDAQAWWDALPAGLRQRFENLIVEGRNVVAVKLLRTARPHSSPDLATLVDLALSNLDRPPERERPRWSELVDRLETVDAPIAAIETTWEIDTLGWHVALSAVVTRPSLLHPTFDAVWLGAYRSHEGDLRLFEGTVPPWPEALHALEDGTRLAAQLSVPFRFASPDHPDLDQPRWWDSLDRRN